MQGRSDLCVHTTHGANQTDGEGFQYTRPVLQKLLLKHRGRCGHLVNYVGTTQQDDTTDQPRVEHTQAVCNTRAAISRTHASYRIISLDELVPGAQNEDLGPTVWLGCSIRLLRRRRRRCDRPGGHGMRASHVYERHGYRCSTLSLGAHGDSQRKQHMHRQNFHAPCWTVPELRPRVGLATMQPGEWKPDTACAGENLRRDWKLEA